MNAADESRFLELVRLGRELDRRAKVHAVAYPHFRPSEDQSHYVLHNFLPSPSKREDAPKRNRNWVFDPLLRFIFENGVLLAAVGHFHGPEGNRVREWTYFLSERASEGENCRNLISSLTWYVRGAVSEQGSLIVLTTDLAEKIQKWVRDSKPNGPYEAPLLVMLQDRRHGTKIDATLKGYGHEELLLRLDLRSVFPGTPPSLVPEPLSAPTDSTIEQRPSAQLKFPHPSNDWITQYSENLRALRTARPEPAWDDADHGSTVREYIALQTDPHDLLTKIANYAAWVSSWNLDVGSVLTMNAFGLEEWYGGRSAALFMCFHRDSPLVSAANIHLVTSAFRLGCVNLAQEESKSAGTESALVSFGHETSKVLSGLTKWVVPHEHEHETDKGVVVKRTLLADAMRGLQLWTFRDTSNPFDHEYADFSALARACWRAARAMRAPRELYSGEVTTSSDVEARLVEFVRNHPDRILELEGCDNFPRLDWSKPTGLPKTLAVARVLVCLFGNAIEKRTPRDSPVELLLERNAGTDLWTITISNRSLPPPPPSPHHFGSLRVAEFALRDLSATPPSTEYDQSRKTYSVKVTFRYDGSST